MLHLVSTSKIAVHISFIFCCLATIGCGPRDAQSSRDAVASLLALLSSSAPITDAPAQSFSITMGKKTVNFTQLDGGTVKLAQVLRTSFVSGSDPVPRRHGSRREKVGMISVSIQGKQIPFNLYRSVSMPTLYAINVPDVDSAGSSILYFIDYGDFGALLSQ